MAKHFYSTSEEWKVHALHYLQQSLFWSRFYLFWYAEPWNIFRLNVHQPLFWWHFYFFWYAEASEPCDVVRLNVLEGILGCGIHLYVYCQTYYQFMGGVIRGMSIVKIVLTETPSMKNMIDSILRWYPPSHKNMHAFLFHSFPKNINDSFFSFLYTSRPQIVTIIPLLITFIY